MEIGDTVRLITDAEPTDWTVLDIQGDCLLLKRSDGTYATAEIQDTDPVDPEK